MRLGYLAVAASAILFSAKAVLIKLSYAQGAEPTALMALRVLYCLPFFLAMAGVAWVKGRESRRRMSRRDLAAVAGLGFLGFYLSMAFNMHGLKYVSAGMERMILFVYPTLVVLFGALILKKGLDRALILPLLITYAGIALSFGGEAMAGHSSRPVLGGALVLVSAVCYALFMVFQGPFIERLGPQRITSFGMLAGGAFALVHFAATRPLASLAQPLPVQGLTLVTAALCTVAPAYLLGYGIHRIGTGPAAVVSCVGPVSTFLLAMLLLGEKAGPLQVVGLGLVLLGGLRLAGRKAAPKPVPAPVPAPMPAVPVTPAAG